MSVELVTVLRFAGAQPIVRWLAARLRQFSRGDATRAKTSAGIGTLPIVQTAATASPHAQTVEMANPPTIALRRSGSPLRHPSGVSRRSRPWQWLALLGLVSGSCLCLPVLVPTPAHAYVARMEITLDRLPDETYDTLLRRAESVARAAAQRGFDRDVLVSELSIVVMAQNRGLTAPILALRVSRMQWSHRPDAGLWITYFRTARDLLGLGGMSQPTATPPTAPPPTPPAPVSTPQPAATPPTATPAASPTPAASETPAASPTPAETNEASPSPPPTQPQQRPLVIPQGSGVPRIPTLPPL